MQKLMAGLLLLMVAPAHAALNIFACEPEWAALVQELGGEQVSVYSATTGMQDVHRIEARPSLIAKARRADLLVCTGGELEAGWLPQLLRQSANPAIQPGQAGYFEAVNHVTRIEQPARLDRAEGDVHAGGNPHIHTDPRNIRRVADALFLRLVKLDANHAPQYESRYKAFTGRWQQSILKWEAQAAKLKGLPVVVQHKHFSYLLAWLGMREVGMLEPKPGLEPTPAHLAQLLEGLKRAPAKLVIRASFQDDHAANWLAERARLPVAVLPASVGGSDKARDLTSFFDDLIARLLEAQS